MRTQCRQLDGILLDDATGKLHPPACMTENQPREEQDQNCVDYDDQNVSAQYPPYEFQHLASSAMAQ